MPSIYLWGQVLEKVLNGYAPKVNRRATTISRQLLAGRATSTVIQHNRVSMEKEGTLIWLQGGLAHIPYQVVRIVTYQI